MAERQLLLWKKETVTGTDAAPVAVDYIWAENVKYTPKGNYVTSNPAKPGLGPVPRALVGEYGELTFDVPLAAGGVAGTAPLWGKLMKAVGWTETLVATTSVTYSLMPDTSVADSGTAVWREGLRSHKLTYARGMVGLKLTNNQRPIASFTFRGLYLPVAPGAILTHADATFTGWKDVLPIAQGRTTFSLAAAPQPLWDLSLNQSDNVLFRDVPHQETVQLVGKRTWTGSLKIKTPAVGTTNLEALCQANTVSTFALVHGTTAGSIVTVNGRAQTGMPDYSDDSGEDLATVDLALVPSLLSTDDEIAIVLT